LNTPLLQVQDLSIAFGHGENSNLVVSGVSFDLYAGETLAMVGESGSGKSLTAHAILQLLPYPLANHPSGKILFEGKDLLQLPEKKMRGIRGNRISMIFQEPMNALNPLHTVEKQVGEIICQHRGIRKAEARPLVIELLSKVLIPEPERRLSAYPHELSGGQRQRVMIAMALANEPDVLIADEPTTALDVTVQKEILELLRSLQQQRKLAMLFITHDLGIVRQVANRVVVLKEGQVVESDECRALFANPRQAYTRLLIDSELAGVPATVESFNDVPLLRVAGLGVSFPLAKSVFGKTLKSFHAVKEASFSILPGTTLGIVGESGSGKSTIALAILRLLKSKGEIYFRGADISRYPERKLRPLRKNFQIVFQDPFTSLSPRMTAEEVIAEGLLVHTRISRSERQQRVVDVMQEVGLDPDTRHRYPHEFSGGQRQRIAIARALILNPDLILLDEPTSALDKSVQLQVVDLLRKLQVERGLSYLFISHDLAVIRALSHRIIVMKEGEIIEQGDAETLLNQPGEPYTQALLAAAL